MLARALLDAPKGQHYGYDLMRSTGLQSGTLYPILKRMRAEGWLVAEWETPGQVDRPPRRYYRMTELGLGELAKVRDAGRHT